jgi:RNA polymerase sigma-70 factor (ECF subfamily)
MEASVANDRAVVLTGWASPGDARPAEEEALTDERAEFESIYRKYGAMVRRRCLAILGRDEEADDAMQEVFIRAFRSLSGFRGQSSPATWLYRIATNICLNRLRDARNRERLDREALLPLEPQQPVESWPRDLALRVLGEFDTEVRETVLYVVVEGMTADEVSRVMGCSGSLVRKRLAKFRDRAPRKAVRLLGGVR